MAVQLGRCRRSVIRYSTEAVELGYLQVFRTRPERGPDGRWCRRKTNAYYFTVPAADTAGRPAPRRRQRAPYCIVRRPVTPSPDRRDSDGTSSPFGGAITAAAPAVSDFPPVDTPETGWTGAMSPTVADAIAHAKARLRASTVGHRIRK